MWHLTIKIHGGWVQLSSSALPSLPSYVVRCVNNKAIFTTKLNIARLTHDGHDTNENVTELK